MESIRIVILKCPYVNWGEKETQIYFSKMVDLKLKSYSEKHHVGVMPVDTTDFVCDHILICREKENDLVPILGVKTLDYRRCNSFHIDFTIEAFLKKGEHEKHLESLYTILDSCKKDGENISYYSSWAMLPEVTRNRPLSASLKKIFTGLTVLHHTQENVSQLLGLGVPKYKTDEFFATWGFQRVRHNDAPLENIPFFILGGIDGVFIHLKNYTQFALDCADETMDLWKNRIVIGKNPKQDEKLDPDSTTKRQKAYR